MKICIEIGDWSNDGHGKKDDFYFESNKTIQEVREAYFKAKETYPDLCPETFCHDYEDDEVPEEVIESAAKLGFVIDPEEFYTSEMAKYTAWFCMLGDSSLNLALIENDAMTLSFYGFDDKKRHIGFIGYGLFYA